MAALQVYAGRNAPLQGALGLDTNDGAPRGCPVQRRPLACAVCFNGANLCVQLHGGETCKGLEQTCRCLADARGLL